MATSQYYKLLQGIKNNLDVKVSYEYILWIALDKLFDAYILFRLDSRLPRISNAYRFNGTRERNKLLPMRAIHPVHIRFGSGVKNERRENRISKYDIEWSIDYFVILLQFGMLTKLPVAHVYSDLRP